MIQIVNSSYFKIILESLIINQPDVRRRPSARQPYVLLLKFGLWWMVGFNSLSAVWKQEEKSALSFPPYTAVLTFGGWSLHTTSMSCRNQWSVSSREVLSKTDVDLTVKLGSEIACEV